MKNSHPTHYYIYRLFGIATIVLSIALLLLILVSWLITAAAPELMVRSLLSAEGVRWFVGHLTDNVQTPLLVWLLMASVAVGSIAKAWQAHKKSPSKTALRIVVFEITLSVVVLLLLSVMPHALLLSVTGNLFPSSFSDGLLPIICFVAVICSLTYCIVNRQVRTVADAYAVLCYGAWLIGLVAPLYIVVSQLYFSVIFVFGN